MPDCLPDEISINAEGPVRQQASQCSPCRALSLGTLQGHGTACGCPCRWAPGCEAPPLCLSTCEPSPSLPQMAWAPSPASTQGAEGRRTILQDVGRVALRDTCSHNSR